MWNSLNVVPVRGVQVRHDRIASVRRDIVQRCRLEAFDEAPLRRQPHIRFDVCPPAPVPVVLIVALEELFSERDEAFFRRLMHAGLVSCEEVPHAAPAIQRVATRHEPISYRMIPVWSMHWELFRRDVLLLRQQHCERRRASLCRRADDPAILIVKNHVSRV